MERIKPATGLARASEEFSVEMFRGRGLPEQIKKALDVAGRWQQRNRLLAAPVLVWLVLLMSLHRRQSIKNVFKLMIDLLREVEPDLSLNEVSEEALYHGRARLGPEPLHVLFEELAAGIKPEASFHGLRVWGIDGLRLNMPDTPANEAAFGRPTASRGQTAFPQMLTVVLVDTDNHRVKDFVEYGTKGSEREGCQQLIKHLTKEDVVLLDRGFPDTKLFQVIMLGTHFVARIPSTWKPRKIRCLGPGDWIVEVRVSEEIPPEQRTAKGRKWNHRYYELRMIEYRVGGEIARILTDLTDPVKYPAMDLVMLYHQRWEVELVFDEIETHLHNVTHGTLDTVFRSKTPAGVRQELPAMFAAYNLVRDTIAEASKRHDISPLEISFVDSLEVIRRTVPTFQGADPVQQAKLEERLYQDIADCHLDRTRRPRWYPRVVKVKMSKFKVKRSEDKQVIIDFQQLIELVELKPRSSSAKAA